MKTTARIRIIVLINLVMIPFVFLLFLSIAGTWFFPDVLPGHWSLNAWHGLFSGNDFWWVLLKSVVLSSSVAILATAMAFFISRQLSRHRYRDILHSIAYLPYSFSPVIYAFCIQFLFIRSGLKGTYAGVLIAQLLISFPFAVLLFSKHWNHELKNQEILSMSLGASEYQTIVRVTLPLTMRLIKLSLIQTFLISWFDYGISLVIGRGIAQTAILRIYQYIAEANIAYAATASLVLLIPPVMLSIVQHKLSSNVA